MLSWNFIVIFLHQGQREKSIIEEVNTSKEGEISTWSSQRIYAQFARNYIFADN